MSRRFESGRLLPGKPAAGGGFTVPAFVARAGIVKYTNADGSTRREYRPPEEVFHPDAIASFANATVTEGHPRHLPRGMVTDENWHEVAAGHLSHLDAEPTTEDGQQWATGPVTVKRASLAAKVAAGTISECSLGYDCQVDPTPGVTPDGQRYDAVQRRIRGNHLALLPPGKARHGEGASLRLDSNDDQTFNGEPTPMAKPLFRLDGVDYEVDSPQFGQAIKNTLDAQTKQISDLTARAAAAEARADAAEADRDKAKDELAAQPKLDSLVSAELDFRQAAGKHLPEDYNFAGKSQHQVRLDALTHRNVEVPEGKSEVYVEARFDGLEPAQPTTPGRGSAAGRAESVSGKGRVLVPRKETK